MFLERSHETNVPIIRVRERRSSVAVLLCGTSGTGKSTLASLLAARLGITTLLSTVRLERELELECRFRA